ncbi:mitochondrial protein [Cylindrobasidium torrendii FP15055 ss-10]|uniref:Mitochondrial protein n=1 Tax=Cylindrobasidium torrendii FP15055 ss-10 TaxID=1314674 RepID=A0A0D7AX53_9AGAR|nr:mitochondrial protein [Cylindrobasidium torrendii FP15055 ss-10]
MLRDETPALSPPMQNTANPLDNEPEEIQKLLAWQAERQAKRMRGEYESEAKLLGEVINSNRSTYLNLHSVRVEGAHNTRDSFLGYLINPILAKDGIHDLEGVLHKTREISDVLLRTDNFKTLDVRLERARDPLASEYDMDLVVHAHEKGRIFFKTATELGNSEGGVNITGRVRNVFGGAETLMGSMSAGTTTKKSFSASLSAPVSRDLWTTAELALYGLAKDNSSFASSSEDVRGMKATVRHGVLTKGMHECAYEAALRNVGSLVPTASISIREAAGVTSKSAISHTYTFDTRDAAFAATHGMLFKARTELAGIGGGTRFLKSEAEGQVSRNIFPGLSWSFALRSGLMSGLGKPVPFPDRFQLGGPTSVRAFKFNGLGPRDGVDSLGGDLYWSAGFSLISEIPKLRSWPMNLHMWVNAGQLNAMDASKSLLQNVGTTIARPSISAGVGLIYRFDPVRVELNLGVPLVASQSDNMRRGIQVGMGLEFL